MTQTPPIPLPLPARLPPLIVMIESSSLLLTAKVISSSSSYSQIPFSLIRALSILYASMATSDL